MCIGGLFSVDWIIIFLKVNQQFQAKEPQYCNSIIDTLSEMLSTETIYNWIIFSFDMNSVWICHERKEFLINVSCISIWPRNFWQEINSKDNLKCNLEFKLSCNILFPLYIFYIKSDFLKFQLIQLYVLKYLYLTTV